MVTVRYIFLLAGHPSVMTKYSKIIPQLDIFLCTLSNEPIYSL